MNKLHSEKEIFNYEKKVIANLSFMLSSGKCLNSNLNDEKFIDCLNKISINNVTFPNSTGVTNSSCSMGGYNNHNLTNISHHKHNSMNNSQKDNSYKKKEVVIEKPYNYFTTSFKEKDMLEQRHRDANESIDNVSRGSSENRDRAHSSKANLNKQLQLSGAIVSNFSSNDTYNADVKYAI
jgi:hypothetical protein